MAKGCSRLAALLLAGMVIIACPFAVWSGAGVSAMLSPDTYKNGLANQNIYREIVPSALTALANNDPPGNTEPVAQQVVAIVNALDADELRAITDELVPPDYLQSQTERAIDALFGWLNGSSATLDAEIDLSLVREHLAGADGSAAATRIIQSAPPCAQEQINQLRAWRSSDEQMPPICQPPPLLARPLVEWLTRFLAEIGSGLGRDPIAISQLLDVGGELPLLRTRIAVVQQLVLLLYLIAAALLALIVTIRVHSLHGFGRWMSWAGLLSGLVALIPVLLVPLITLDSLVSLTSGLQSNPLEASLAAGFYASILTQFGNPVLVQAAILMVVGFVLLAVSVFAPAVEEPARGRKTVTVPTPPLKGKD